MVGAVVVGVVVVVVVVVGVVVVVVVVRSVVSQVSELRKGVVFARVPPQQDTTALFSRLRNSTVRT